MHFVRSASMITRRGFENALVDYARGPSRRGFLRLLAGAVAMTVSGGATLAPAAAAAEPTCFWQFPAHDLSTCAKVRHHDGHTPTTNGCGSGDWKGKLVPNGWGRADFKPSCDQHDVCYGTCGSNKADCDVNLSLDAMKACDAAYGDSPIRQAACYTVALAYGEAVHKLGDGPYNEAQEEDCDCCRLQNVAYCQPDDSCWYSASACLQVCPSGLGVTGQNLCGPPPQGKCGS